MNKLYKHSFLVTAFVILFSSISFAAEVKEIPPFTKDDRVLIFAPHPDDETIGCAGVIQRALKSGSQVKVVYLTYGDNNIFSILFYNKLLFPLKLIFLRGADFVGLGQERKKEAISAMAILGLKEDNLVFLGYPDHGTDQIFVFHWGRRKPYRSFFSERSSVPYKDSKSYNKDFKGDNVLDDVKRIILDYKPTKIFVSHPADLNGDHWALYLYTGVALADLYQKIPDPQVYPYLVHVPAWPLPRNYHPELEIELPKEFFADSSAALNINWFKLSPEEIEKKHAAMLAYKSQTAISAFYLLAFVRQNELFSDFPMIIVKRQNSAELPAGAGQTPYIFTADNQWIAFAVVDGYLLLRAKKPVELKNRSSFLFFISPYKIGVPFGELPNIAVLTKYNKFTIYNTLSQKTPIDPKDTSIQFNSDSIVLKIPLSILGNPDGFLFAFNAYNKFLPLGCTAFRGVEIE